MYRERVERQYKTVNPHATQQVARSSARWLMTRLHFIRHLLISTPAASERGAGRRWLGHICNYVRGSTCWCVAAACDPVFLVLQLVFAREKTCAEFTCVAAKDALADIQEKHRDIKKLERSIGWFNPLAQAFSFSFLCRPASPATAHPFASKYSLLPQVELAQLFQDMAILVESQGELINSIDNNGSHNYALTP